MDNETMMKEPNTYADRFKPLFGVPTIRPTQGESFDLFNDLFLEPCGTVVTHRDGHVTRGTVYSVTSDALIDYNRRHMSASAFAEFYADDGDIEFMMLHGDAV